MRSTTSSSTAAPALYAGAAIVSGAGMVVFPLFPTIQEQHGISTGALGAVAGAGFVAAMVAELLVAPQADRGHARRMVLSSVVLMAASLFVLGAATGVPTLVAGRALGGFAFGLFIAASAAVLVRARPEHPGEQLGRLAVAELGGLAVGPLVASGLLAVGGTATAAWVLGVVVLASVVPMAVALRAGIDAPPAHGDNATGRGAHVPHLAFDLLRSPQVTGAALLTVAVMIPTGAYDSIWPRFLDDLGASSFLVAVSYTAFAVPYMLVATPAGRLADRIGGLAASWRGMLIVVAMITSYMWLQSPVPAALVGFVESTGQAVAYTAASAAIAAQVPVSRAGAAQGLARALGTMGATVVSFASGPVYAGGGAVPLFGGTIVLVLVTMVAATVLLRRGTAPAPAEPMPPVPAAVGAVRTAAGLQQV